MTDHKLIFKAEFFSYLFANHGLKREALYINRVGDYGKMRAFTKQEASCFLRTRKPMTGYFQEQLSPLMHKRLPRIRIVRMQNQPIRSAMPCSPQVKVTKGASCMAVDNSVLILTNDSRNVVIILYGIFVEWICVKYPAAQ